MRPAFERAARTGDVSGLEAELNGGADVDSLDAHGQTALMLAAHKGHLDAVQRLVGHGADLNVRAKFGLSALMLAIVAGHEAVACALVRAGADLKLLGTGAPGFTGKSAYDLAKEQGMVALCAEIATRQDVAF
jgi:ankyrin repeat protein